MVLSGLIIDLHLSSQYNLYCDDEDPLNVFSFLERKWLVEISKKDV